MKWVLAASAAVAALSLAAAPALADTPAQRGEARLAQMLEGRVAGEPRSCISAMDSNRIRVIEHVGVVYERGDTIWVARVANPNQLRYDDVPIFERFGSQLCRQDVTRTIDRNTGFITGAVFLEPFVPYTRQG